MTWLTPFPGQAKTDMPNPDGHVAQQSSGREAVDHIVGALTRIDERLTEIEVSVRLLEYKVNAAVGDSQEALRRVAEVSEGIRHMREQGKRDHDSAMLMQSSISKHLEESEPLIGATQTLIDIAKAEQAKAWMSRKGGMILRFLVLVGGAFAAVSAIGASAWHIMKSTVAR